MKRIVAVCLLSALSCPSFAALKEGDLAPRFSAPASLDGKEFPFSLDGALKKGPVVVYFYPSAFTRGCNLQAHTFSTKADKFAAAGAMVIGVSLDKIATLNKFSADPEYCAGKVAVASDAGGKIARSYDLQIKEAAPGMVDSRGTTIDHGFAERTTFVIDRDGRIVATIGGVQPVQNVEKALEIVQGLSAKHGGK